MYYLTSALRSAYWMRGQAKPRFMLRQELNESQGMFVRPELSIFILAQVSLKSLNCKEQEGF